MGCTLTVIKKFQLLKESLIQMIQDVKVYLTDNLIINQTKDEPMTTEERCIDYNKIMLYSCLTALSKVHNLSTSAISNIVSEVIESENFSEEEKGKFCVDLLLHNFMRPFHCSRVEEEQYYWNLLLDKAGAEAVEQVLKFCKVFLENLTSKDLKAKSYNDIVKKNSLIKGLYIIRVISQYLKGKSYTEFIDLVLLFLSKTKYFTYKLLKSMLFRYLKRSIIADILNQSLYFLKSSKDRDIEFGLKISCLCSSVRERLQQHSTTSNILNLQTIKNELICLLDIVIQNKFPNVERKIVKIVNIISNCYKVNVTQEEQILIANKIIECVKLGKIEAYVTYDVAMCIRNTDFIHLQLCMIAETEEQFMKEKIPDIDAPPYRKWVKIIHRYFQVIKTIQEIKILPSDDDQLRICDVILKLSKIKIRLKRLKILIEKNLKQFDDFLNIIIILLRCMIGKANQSICELTFNKIYHSNHEMRILKSEFGELFVSDSLVSNKFVSFLDKYFYYFI